MVAEMDAADVDGAILVSAYAMYRYDPSYALEVCNRHPDRFAVVTPVDPADPAVADVIADWKAHAGRRRRAHAAGAQRPRDRSG